MSGATSDFVDVRGYRLRLSRKGEGPALLLLNDFLGPQSWQPYMDALCATHEVILPEHPGFGAQPAPAWLDNVSDLANFYLDLLDELDVQRATLLGCGCGGWVAADLAIRNPARVERLVLSAAAGLYMKGVLQTDTFLLSEEDAVRSLFHDAALAEPVVAAMMAPELEDARLQNLEVTARLTWEPRMHDPDLRKWLHRIDLPTLIIWGAQDRIFPHAYAEEWRSLIPGARLETLPDCGHAPQLEAPEAFARLIQDFRPR